jgi:S1-C subfamily serine protease
MQILNSNSPQTSVRKPISDIVKEVKPGVVHIVHTVDGQRAGSGTGFMVNGYLVTNYHVAYQAPRNSVVTLRTYDSAPQILLDGIQLTSQDFLNSSVTASDERGYDYIVFDIPQLIGV